MVPTQNSHKSFQSSKMKDLQAWTMEKALLPCKRSLSLQRSAFGSSHSGAHSEKISQSQNWWKWKSKSRFLETCNQAGKLSTGVERQPQNLLVNTRPRQLTLVEDNVNPPMNQCSARCRARKKNDEIHKGASQKPGNKAKENHLENIQCSAHCRVSGKNWIVPKKGATEKWADRTAASKQCKDRVFNGSPLATKGRQKVLLGSSSSSSPPTVEMARPLRFAGLRGAPQRAETLWVI